MPVRALARVNLSAIERNVARLCAELDQPTALCAVVKADGYGHGAIPAARAALAGGARWLAVATAAEAAELRTAGFEVPVLVMGAISSEELADVIRCGADVVAWAPEFVAELQRAEESAVRGADPIGVHVKLDTGMGRLGTRDEAQALEVAELVSKAGPTLQLAGAMTHFATADGDPEFVAAQLARFEPFVSKLRSRWPGLVVHAANSAATLTEPRSHFDVVRCGIAIYGCDPMNDDPHRWGLEPALELTSYIAALKRAAPGDTVGYGRTFAAVEETWIATVPIGYGDGVRRALSNNCDVLVRGRSYPLVGTVSMDNITLDMGREPQASIGDAVTLLGVSAGQPLTAEQMAARMGTINYEVVCGISKRVPRQYHRDGEAE
ncbi:MAG TPA: alanine racemase [Solirubrobacteraceae bacterium]|nr:alanine racemase [Solirubrobacteraceae bacterium]